MVLTRTQKFGTAKQRRVHTVAYLYAEFYLSCEGGSTSSVVMRYTDYTVV